MTFRNVGIGLAIAELFLAEGEKVVKTGPNQATREAVPIERPIAKAVENLANLEVVFATLGITAATPWENFPRDLRAGTQSNVRQELWRRTAGSYQLRLTHQYRCLGGPDDSRAET
jgi:NAD(P)-dependent dehydrogenase (short-subunit alcohol dehydrogenase family)